MGHNVILGFIVEILLCGTVERDKGEKRKKGCVRKRYRIFPRAHFTQTSKERSPWNALLKGSLNIVPGLKRHTLMETDLNKHYYRNNGSIVYKKAILRHCCAMILRYMAFETTGEPKDPALVKEEPYAYFGVI